MMYVYFSEGERKTTLSLFQTHCPQKRCLKWRYMTNDQAFYLSLQQQKIIELIIIMMS